MQDKTHHDAKADHNRAMTIVAFGDMPEGGIETTIDLPNGVGTLTPTPSGQAVWSIRPNVDAGFPAGQNVLTSSGMIVPGDLKVAVTLAQPATYLRFRITSANARVVLKSADGKTVWNFKWEESSDDKLTPSLIEKLLETAFTTIEIEGSLSCSDIILM